MPRSLRSLLMFCLSATGCGGAGAQVSPPSQTMASYAAAVRADDARAAYSLLDEDTRAEVQFEDFERLMGENREELREQATELERITAQGVDAQARVALRNGETVTLVLEEGRWVVDGGVLDAPSLRTPRDTVLALRRALSRRSLRGVARVLARQPRAELEAEIERILEETDDELDLEVEVRGNNARVRTTGGRELLLVRESGEWRVLEVR